MERKEENGFQWNNTTGNKSEPPSSPLSGSNSTTQPMGQNHQSSSSAGGYHSPQPIQNHLFASSAAFHTPDNQESGSNSTTQPMGQNHQSASSAGRYYSPPIQNHRINSSAAFHMPENQESSSSMGGYYMPSNCLFGSSSASNPPENHQSASSAAASDMRRLLLGSPYHHHPQQELNFLHSIPLAEPSPYGNPSFPSYQDLGAAFSRLNISSSSRQDNGNPSFHAAGISGSVPRNNLGFDTFVPGEGLLRQRVRAAARGQMGMFMQDHAYSILDQNYLQGLNPANGYLYNNVQNGGPSLVTAPNPYLRTLGSGMSQNGFESPYVVGNGVLVNSNGNGLGVDKNLNHTGLSINGFGSVSGVFGPSSSHNHLYFSDTLFPLEELRGTILSMAKDQNGSTFLQKKCEEGNPNELDMIFVEIRDDVCELMVDQFGNYFIQKFFTVCNSNQIGQMLFLVVRDQRILLSICTDSHGYA